MNADSIALFLHIVGTLGFFVALGLEWTGLRQIQSVMTLEQVGVWVRILKSVRKIGFAFMLTTILTGIYMMVTDSGGASWMFVSLGALVLVIVLSLTLTGPRMATIGRTLVAEKRPIPQMFHVLASQPLLWISIQSRVSIALGIVFLMTIKPDLYGSLLTIAIAIVLGVASALSVSRREQEQARLPD